MPLPSSPVRKNVPIAWSVGVLSIAFPAGAVKGAVVPPAKMMAIVTAICPVNRESWQAQNIQVVSTNAKDGRGSISLTWGGRTFRSRLHTPEAADAAGDRHDRTLRR